MIESEGVKRRYEEIVSALKGEAASYTTTIDTLHSRLSQENQALKRLRVSNFVIKLSLNIY